MNKQLFFNLISTDNTTTESVNELRNILAPYGIYALYIEPTHCLAIYYDTDTIKRIRKRKAGRKQKFFHSEKTVAQVLAMLETKSKTAVAQELGMSRTTFYRRLNVYLENGNLDAIFH